MITSAHLRPGAASNGRDLVLYADAAFRSSAGIERYTRELIRGLSRDQLAERLTLLCTRPAWAGRLRQAVESLPPSPRPDVVLAERPGRLLRIGWTFANRPSVERLTGSRVLLSHSPMHVRFPSPGAEQLGTVHDIYPMRQPSLMPLRDRVMLQRLIQDRAIRSATHLIAVSEHTKADVCATFDVDPTDITVVLHGVDHEMFRPTIDPERIRQVRQRYGLSGPFLLFLGSLYPRKLGRLLEAFQLVQRRIEPGLRLVLAGGRETHTKPGALGERVERLGLSDHVILTGTVPEEDMPVLMSQAEVFVYPSLYEGFGMSVLEAMACGAPVVVSNTTSLPEVVAEAGLLVDPTDADQIAGAIERVLRDDAERSRLREASINRARAFTWERAARLTAEVYRGVLQQQEHRSN